MERGVPGSTRSLCPVCLRTLDAVRVQRGAEVQLERECPEHGRFSETIWRGEPSLASWRRPKKPSPPNPGPRADKACPRACGLCPDHSQHTCTLLVEVTARCDLRCPVCFASSGADGPAGPPLEELAARLWRFRAKAGQCNLQLSGGEPTTRADLPGIVRAARDAGFAFVQLNTNGLRLAREPGYASGLARAGLSSVFLQYDGSDAACLELRGKKLSELKARAVEACAQAGLGVVLVPTLAAGVNDDECFDIVRQALDFGPGVRGVHFQPMAAFGRHPGGGLRGPTLPEALTALTGQSRGMLRPEHFHPPGCEHEQCSFSGVFLRRGGGLVPAPGSGGCCEPRPGAPAEAPSALEGAVSSRAFTARQWAAPAASSRSESVLADDFDRFLAEAGAHNRFSISCMAFQDVWSVDLERLRGCCIHVGAPDGSLVPFCAYNLTSASGEPLHRGLHGEDAT